MRLTKVAALLIALVLFSACTTPQFAPASVGKNYPQRTFPDKVELFRSQTPTKKYVEIGSTSVCCSSNTEDLVTLLRQKASENGGDALIGLDVGADGSRRNSYSLRTTMMEVKATPFTSYQKFVVALLAFLQFTIILDFMIVSPLGALLMPALHISPSQFGLAVSVYAFSAGTAGLFAAGFADRFDRKKFLLFFYAGFVLGTLLCGIANSYYFLLAARTITGLFGGVIGSIVFAIMTDLFPLEMRGRVMGFLQTAFAASQVLGLPMGLFLSNHWGWHAPFLMIVFISTLVGFVIIFRLKPVDAHLKFKVDHSAFHHLKTTVTTPKYLLAFAATALLSVGGFMLMPFGSAYTVHNLKIGIENLPTIYLITGLCSIVIGPLVGKACDAFGKFPTFVCGTTISIIMVLIYTNLGPISLPMLIFINSIMFVGIFSRMIPSQALISAIPEPSSRGSFMSVSASLQQISGGFASVLAGLIVVEGAEGVLLHFNILGYVMVGTALTTLCMMYIIHRAVPEKPI